MRHDEIDSAVAIDVGRCDRRGRVVGERRTGRSEAAAPLVEAEILNRMIGSIRHHDIRLTISVEVRDGDVPGLPVGLSKGRSTTKVARAVIEKNHLRVWSVVAEDHVQCAVAVDVHQVAGIRAIAGIGQIIRRGEMAMSVAEQHAAHPRPVASLYENDVQLTISVDIADAHIRGGVGRGLELQGAGIGREGRRLGDHEQTSPSDDRQE
jgi:hypothetical protein